MSQRLPGGVRRYCQSDLTPEEARLIFERDQLLWIRLDAGSELSASFDLPTLFAASPGSYKKHFSVENASKNGVSSLSADRLFGGEGQQPSHPYYVSCILQQNPAARAEFLRAVPHSEHPLLDGARHDDGIWLFLGANPLPPSKGGRKRRRPDEAPPPLLGRPEHVDEVDHAGTWHVQLSGSKTWFIRPSKEAEVWDSSPPVLHEGEPCVVEGTRGKGARRIRIQVEQGEMLLLNTAAWWHRTELEAQPGLSISYALDLYLDGGGAAAAAAASFDEEEEEEEEGVVRQPLLASADFAAGDVVLEEEDLPEEFERDESPNCVLAEVEGEGEGESEEIVLVALRPVRRGEALTLAPDEEEEEGETAKSNRNGIDPRCIAARDFSAGDVLLSGEELPEDLPRSNSPNCELTIEDDGAAALRALRGIAAGEVLAVAPQEGEEYDEWELSESGEMKLVENQED